MKKIFIVIFALVLVGCNPIETFQEMAEKQSEFNKISLQELGVEAFVGWNIHNGVLNSVTVMYPQGTLSDLTVGELDRKTLEIVKKVFEEKPRSVTYGFQTVQN